MARLVVLTRSFPHAPGEEFLRPEVGRLARMFDQVDIVRTEPAPGAPIAMPGNIRVHAVPRGSQSRAVRAVSTASLLRDAASRRWFRADLPQASAYGTRGLSRLALQVHRALDIRKALRPFCADAPQTVFYSYWFGPAAMALAMLKESGSISSAVARVHGADLYWERQTPSYHPLQRRVAETLDCVYAISDHGRRYLSQKAPGARIHVRRLGVDAAEPALPSGDGVLRIVSCSHVVPVKRLDRLVDALSLCPIPLEWTHIGSGPALERLRARASRVPPNVRTNFVGGLEHDAVLAWYDANAVDAFVNVSASEGLPVSIGEAMRRGIPAIATDVGGTAELVGDSGWLLSADSGPQEIANAIIAISRLSTPERDARRRAARDRASDLFDASRNFDTFARELRSMVE